MRDKSGGVTPSRIGRAARPWLIALVALPLLFTGAALTSRAPAQNPGNSLQGRAQFVPSPTPESGVKLLEDILNRVRSVPQLAMAKQNRLLAESQAAQSAVQSSPTDYRLAIKPKEDPRVFAPAADEAFANIREEAEMEADNKGIWERGRTLAGGTVGMPSPALINQARGLWERQNEEAKESLSAESHRRLSQSLDGVYDIANRMQEAGNLARGMSETAHGAQAKKARTLTGAEAPKRLPPAMLDSLARNTPGASPAAAPAPQPRAAGRLDVPAASSYRDKAERKDLIALSPPTVVMGIPMVRLHCSEAQASHALAAVGTARKMNVNGWTIWSYRRPNTRQTALQVYMRHGVVEALRIFDSSLIAPDFGVRLGDDLSTVKKRFGEPAFILSEPMTGVGQNYVYPISQVGFLFARSNKSAPPKVASLFIFNVK